MIVQFTASLVTVWRGVILRWNDDFFIPPDLQPLKPKNLKYQDPQPCIC
jgi:hypothetical protein